MLSLKNQYTLYKKRMLASPKKYKGARPRTRTLSSAVVANMQAVRLGGGGIGELAGTGAGYAPVMTGIAAPFHNPSRFYTDLDETMGKKGMLGAYNDLGITLATRYGVKDVAQPRSKAYHEQFSRWVRGAAAHSPASQQLIDAKTYQDLILNTRAEIAAAAEAEASKAFEAKEATVGRRMAKAILAAAEATLGEETTELAKTYLAGEQVAGQQESVILLLQERGLLPLDGLTFSQVDLVRERIANELDKDPMLREHGDLSYEAKMRIVRKWRPDEKKLGELETLLQQTDDAWVQWPWAPTTAELMTKIAQQVEQAGHPERAKEIRELSAKNVRDSKLSNRLLTYIGMDDWSMESFVKMMGSIWAAFLYRYPLIAAGVGAGYHYFGGSVIGLIFKRAAGRLFNLVKSGAVVTFSDLKDIFRGKKRGEELSEKEIEDSASFTMSILQLVEEKRAKLGLLFKPHDYAPATAYDYNPQ